MTGNMYFENARIILIFFFLRIYKIHLFTSFNFVFAFYESQGVHGSQRVGHDLATEEQHESYREALWLRR